MFVFYLSFYVVTCLMALIPTATLLIDDRNHFQNLLGFTNV